MISQELLHRYMNTAENLTEAELKDLRAYFRQLDRAMTICPPEFRIFHRQVQRYCDRLDDMLAPS